MRAILFAFLLFTGVMVNAQQRIPIYCLHGQGSDHRIFDSLVVDTSGYELRFLDYGTPEPGSSMKDFAESILPSIDTAAPFILLGVSLGGMICVELSELAHPEKTIIISSAENRNEFPMRYRFQQKVPLYSVMPCWFYVIGARIAQPLFEPDRNKNKATFKAMLYEKDEAYLVGTVKLIVQWAREDNESDIIRIHGTQDHTIPIRRINDVDFPVKGGSHMMTLTRGGEISRLVEKALEM